MFAAGDGKPAQQELFRGRATPDPMLRNTVMELAVYMPEQEPHPDRRSLPVASTRRQSFFGFDGADAFKNTDEVDWFTLKLSAA